MASPKLQENMSKSQAHYNWAYQREEEIPRNELGVNYHEQKYPPNGVQSLTPVFDVVSVTEDNKCESKSISSVDDNTEAAIESEVKLYKKRFWILGLFSVCSMLNGMQWIQYTVVADTTMCFYGVDIYAVNWTANIYLVVYPPLAFPITWIMERVGIRNSLLIGSFLTFVGTAIQCGCSTPDTFALVMVSQGFAAVAEIFIVSLPPYISATWFGIDELSRATAVAVFGNQFGSALGFIFSPLVMSTDCTRKDLIARGRSIVSYTLASCNLLVLLLIYATFDNKPKIPPSSAQAKKTDLAKNFKRSVWALFKNINYDLLLIAYGIIVGASFALATILFSLVSAHFPHQDTAIGWMGLLSILAGCVASVLAGYILDLTHWYKGISIAIFVLSAASTILFGALLYVHLLWLQFITIGIVGFFIASYLPVGFEYAVEITYPEPETVSATIMLASTTAFGLILAMIGTYLIETYNDIVANSFFCGALLLSTVLIASIKCDFRRRDQKNEPASF